MIRLENVTKFYQTIRGRHYVFRDVSFEIPDGLNIAILGRNGAGKTTLLRLLAGADIPNSGRIIRTGSISWPLGLTSGIQAALTGRENARFACRIQCLPVAEMDAKVAGIEAFAEIGKFFDLPVNTYSGGMRGRLKFAIAMAFDFETYLIDELTAVGDASFNGKARAAFRAKRDRASFIKCSHNMQELLAECDAGILLDQGQLTFFADVEEAARTYLSIVAPGSEDERLARTVRRVERKKMRDEAASDGTTAEARKAKRRSRRRNRAVPSTPHTPAPMAPPVTEIRRRADKHA